MFYNINTAAEINLMRRHELALQEEFVDRESVISLPTPEIISSALRTSLSLWAMLQLFGGSRWF